MRDHEFHTVVISKDEWDKILDEHDGDASLKILIQMIKGNCVAVESGIISHCAALQAIKKLADRICETLIDEF